MLNLTVGSHHNIVTPFCLCFRLQPCSFCGCLLRPSDRIPFRLFREPLLLRAKLHRSLYLRGSGPSRDLPQKVTSAR